MITALGQRVTTQHPHREAPHFVYRLFDREGCLLYIGVTYNPPLRMLQHSRTADWWSDVASARLLVFPDRAYALEKEREAIWQEKPAHNKKADRPLAVANQRPHVLLIRGGRIA